MSVYKISKINFTGTLHRAMLDARFSHLYFCQSLNRLQRGLSAIAELLVGLGYTADLNNDGVTI